MFDKLKQKKFIVTSEVAPPKGTDIKHVLEDVEPLKNRIDGMNVTDLQSSVMRLGSLVMCHFLKKEGHQPIYQVTCRDRNRLALQSDLLSAAVLGIENVLALTGDHPSSGDHPQAKAVFDLDSVQLLEAIKTLQSGKDLAGNELKGTPKFCVGAVVNPGAEPLEPEIIKMEKKIKAGAQFFQTQAVYEADKFAQFMDKVKHFNVPVLAGIVLLKSAKMAEYMNENVAGVFVPQSLIDEMGSAAKENRAKKSINISVRLIKELKPLCQGIHLMALGWDKYVLEILDKAGI